MYKFGKKSLENLKTIHPDLQEIALLVLQEIDLSCQSGMRNQEEQDLLYKKGYSKLRYPNSAHNSDPSMAGDFVPCPTYWSSIPELVRMRESFSFNAGLLGYKLKPMIIFSDGTGDYPHVELDV